VATTEAEVDAEDSEGNIAASGHHDGGAGVPVVCNYEIHKGTVTLGSLKLGPQGSGKVISQIAVGTNNGGWPTIQATGITGATDTATMPTFTLPTASIVARRNAQVIKFAKATPTVWRLTSAQLTASGTIDHALDSDGSVGPMSFRGAKVEISGEGVEISGAVAVTWDSDVTEIQYETKSNANIEFGSGSFSAHKNLAKDT
jgi:hypothetical protein